MVEILTDNIHRIAYATDASAYREVPLGVAYPETVEDVKELIAKARQLNTCLIPRAAGTSIAGQVVGNGIVVDISKHFTKILEINEKERWVRVQPGVVRDELNLALKPYGLFFSPETSTSNRCCVGGMFGNNSCGSHSLIYGSTRHHVISVKGVLSDGSEFDTSDRNGSDLWKRIYSQLETWQSDEKICRQIADNYPDRSLRRRSCGYAIDEAIEGDKIDICKLLAGSEGTLAFITELTLSLDSLPSEKQMVVCAHCNTLNDSFLVNLIALKHNPVAVELMDGQILELCSGNKEQRRNRFFIGGEPAAIIIAEFCGETMEDDAQAFENEVMASKMCYHTSRVYGDDIARVWALRKAGLGVLSGMKGDAKPIGVIEDTAVAPDKLPAYMADFQAMLAGLGLGCVYYGHIGTGELHLRPILNIKKAEDRKLFRQVAYETALLVKKHRGCLSGEHGDGRLRGEFIPLVYGEECYQLMRQVKHCWDPDNVFNSGKIVDTPPMDSSLRYEVGQPYAVEPLLRVDNTCFNWKAAFDECRVEGASGVADQCHALMCSVEQCNGAGDCRKSSLIGGTLCPAYKVSGDETMSTRARSNVIREVLTHGINNLTFNAPELYEVLQSCLACKGCKAECPSNVDMTRIRAELLQQIYDEKGTPLRSWMVARMAKVESLGALVTPIYNFMGTWKPTATMIKRIVGFTPQRAIPKLEKASMQKLVRQNIKPRRQPKGTVYIFADEFTSHQDAQLGLMFAQLLTRLGYNVVIPRHLESGRAAISKGCLRLARRYAVRNVELLSPLVSDDTPLVGIEPSCILSFRDEYPDLVPQTKREDAKHLAKNALLYDEFLVREIRKGNITAEDFSDMPVELWLHGHCHQKALVGVEKTVEMLQLLPNAKVHRIASGCCGMAGSFGYEKEHYKTSLAIGEMVLFPTVRKAMELADKKEIPTVVLAPGTSCRQQILDGTGVRAVHPIELMYKWLKNKKI
jgi:FAD/FMN-containing dehydrogenase/Fe-S oxidoreductase